MGKLYLLLIPLVIWGCEQTFDNVVDTTTENYQLTSVIGIKDSVDLKIPGDSLLSPRLIFTPQSQINKVYFDIYASDNSKLNSSPVEMQEVSNKIYEENFILKRENPIGKYNVSFFVTGFDGKNKQVAISSFYFNNGQDNVPPVISNTVIDPDTVVVLNNPIVIFTSVEAADSNGAGDILEVYYIVYKPDGTTNNSKLLLFDDGNTSEHGDLDAGDGIYSRLIQVDQTNDKGTYRFEFQAIDRSGALSNIINHFVLIQ
ncbi:MAG: hypothetical protein OQK64_07370 [Ignavibacteriaceae bacterium]|jgi:hypothetical protein|nr:hypothetical protein [Ignavibacteriaceae bacterium]MCW8813394.1 hypothetical protein [Chlorobium sp.]MCW8823156.1 hypothetical protein [Ignavibacteriaceae bacterium]MCW8961369.1 hypothetical protein [Ignavibacteriaceae bacterium]MCW9095095.1 hypothetical protein [Ignavibacteriaceae bacterium]